MKHSKSDIKLFAFSKAVYLEEDVFKYFYPFCVVNCSIGAAVIFRQNSTPALMLAVVAMMEYAYFLFAFPVESWHFHRRALSTQQPYAQFLRDSYIERFPESWKAHEYRKIDMKFERLYELKMEKLNL